MMVVPVVVPVIMIVAATAGVLMGVGVGVGGCVSANGRQFGFCGRLRVFIGHLRRFPIDDTIFQARARARTRCSCSSL